jgi:nucleoid-associated protein YgaU
MTPSRLFLCLLATCLLVSCNEESKTDKPVKETSTSTPPKQPPVQTPPPTDEFVDAESLPGRIHIVQPGESLLQLAEHYYNDRGKWRKIWQANNRRLKDPNDIPVGMKLIIP